MYDFKANHLILGNQLVCSSLRKVISPEDRISSSLIVLCVGLRSCEFSPIQISMSIVVMQFLNLLFRNTVQAYANLIHAEECKETLEALYMITESS